MGPMEAGMAARVTVEKARALAARLLNAQPAEIALTTGNSSGWAAAFAALGSWSPGDRILVGRHEWGGNLACMRLIAARAGATIEAIPSELGGKVNPIALQAMLDERVRLIALTWLPANSGLINPASEIGKIARSYGIPYFIDAAQAVGQLPVDVQDLNCDVLTTAGRKALRGPRGTGILYVRQDFLSDLRPAFADCHSAPLSADGEPVIRTDAARFEFGEASVALRCGLVNALQEALEIGLEEIRRRIDDIARHLRSELASVPGLTVHNQGRDLSGLVLFDIANADAESVQRYLSQRGISIGVAHSSFAPIDMKHRRLSKIARASVSYLTTDSEISVLTSALRNML